MDTNKEKQREYSRRSYLKNKDKIRKRSRKRQLDDSLKYAEYQASWFQRNKDKVKERRRNHYHTVVKERKQKSLENSQYVGVTKAAEMIGAKLRTFRQRVYNGDIPATKVAGGYWKMRRIDVEELIKSIPDMPIETKIFLGLRRDAK